MFVLQFALAAQWAGQGTGQLGQPVGRVERREFQRGIPRHAIGKLHRDTAGHLALAGFKGQLWQADLAQVALEYTLPVAFGVLTVDTIEQAIERAGTKAGNKGAEAALSALEMVNVLASLKGGI